MTVFISKSDIVLTCVLITRSYLLKSSLIKHKGKADLSPSLYAGGWNFPKVISKQWMGKIPQRRTHGSQSSFSYATGQRGTHASAAPIGQSD